MNPQLEHCLMSSVCFPRREAGSSVNLCTIRRRLPPQIKQPLFSVLSFICIPSVFSFCDCFVDCIPQIIFVKNQFPCFCHSRDVIFKVVLFQKLNNAFYFIMISSIERNVRSLGKEFMSVRNSGCNIINRQGPR